MKLRMMKTQAVVCLDDGEWWWSDVVTLTEADIVMGAITDKLIVSRKKSIEVLEVECAELLKLADVASAAGKPAGAGVYRAQAALKKQRMDRLKAELAGLQEVANQIEHPVVAKMPNVRKGE